MYSICLEEMHVFMAETLQKVLDFMKSDQG